MLRARLALEQVSLGQNGLDLQIFGADKQLRSLFTCVSFCAGAFQVVRAEDLYGRFPGSQRPGRWIARHHFT